MHAIMIIRQLEIYVYTAVGQVCMERGLGKKTHDAHVYTYMYKVTCTQVHATSLSWQYCSNGIERQQGTRHLPSMQPSPSIDDNAVDQNAAYAGCHVHGHDEQKKCDMSMPVKTKSKADRKHQTVYFKLQFALPQVERNYSNAVLSRCSIFWTPSNFELAV